MDYENLSVYIFNLLETELDSRLYYHNVEHTLGVINDCLLLGKQYELNEQDKIILKTAALLHDIGFLKVYDQHEEQGCKIAVDILPEYGYSSEQIARINRLIEVTNVFVKPENELEYLITDADLFYLGTDEFNRISSNLFKEWSAFNMVNGIQDFFEVQIRFLEKHTYYTPLAKELLNLQKEKNLQLVKDALEDFMNRQS